MNKINIRCTFINTEEIVHAHVIRIYNDVNEKLIIILA